MLTNHDLQIGENERMEEKETAREVFTALERLVLAADPGTRRILVQARSSKFREGLWEF
jgi:hypothetical protein